MNRSHWFEFSLLIFVGAMSKLFFTGLQTDFQDFLCCYREKRLSGIINFQNDDICNIYTACK